MIFKRVVELLSGMVLILSMTYLLLVGYFEPAPLWLKPHFVLYVFVPTLAYFVYGKDNFEKALGKSISISFMVMGFIKLVSKLWLII